MKFCYHIYFVHYNHARQSFSQPPLFFHPSHSQAILVKFETGGGKERPPSNVSTLAPGSSEVCVDGPAS